MKISNSPQESINLTFEELKELHPDSLLGVSVLYSPGSPDHGIPPFYHATASVNGELKYSNSGSYDHLEAENATSALFLELVEVANKKKKKKKR